MRHSVVSDVIRATSDHTSHLLMMGSMAPNPASVKPASQVICCRAFKKSVARATAGTSTRAHMTGVTRPQHASSDQLIVMPDQTQKSAYQ